MADPHHPASTDADAYVHGSMEIAEQVETFHLFVLLAKWGSLATAVVLLFLTVWFFPGGSFMAALIASVVVSVVGWFALKSKPAAAH